MFRSTFISPQGFSSGLSNSTVHQPEPKNTVSTSTMVFSMPGLLLGIGTLFGIVRNMLRKRLASKDFVTITFTTLLAAMLYLFLSFPFSLMLGIILFMIASVALTVVVFKKNHYTKTAKL